MQKRAVLLVVAAVVASACSDGGAELTLSTDDDRTTTEPRTDRAADRRGDHDHRVRQPSSVAPTSRPSRRPTGWL